MSLVQLIRKLTGEMGRLWVTSRGVTLVEYGIALALAIVVGGGAIGSLAVAVNGSMDDAAAELNP